MCYTYIWYMFDTYTQSATYRDPIHVHSYIVLLVLCVLLFMLVSLNRPRQEIRWVEEWRRSGGRRRFGTTRVDNILLLLLFIILREYLVSKPVLYSGLLHFRNQTFEIIYNMCVRPNTGGETEAVKCIVTTTPTF